MTAPTTTAWAIKAPRGNIIKESIRLTKRDCISDEEFEQGYSWREISKELGYRCVKVHIAEAQE